MRKSLLHAGRKLALIVVGLLVAGATLADKPAWAGGGKNQEESGGREHSKGKGKGQDRGEPSRHESARSGAHFADRHRVVVHEYYVAEYRGGRCPPGLAKKRNGCMPPGQAKKWRVGHPLPGDVVFYDLPPALVVELGPPPAGHRFVRVAADILLIAVGTGIVIDARQDLGRM